jgi:hypothetical protein
LLGSNCQFSSLSSAASINGPTTSCPPLYTLCGISCGHNSEIGAFHCPHGSCKFSKVTV